MKFIANFNSKKLILLAIVILLINLNNANTDQLTRTKDLDKNAIPKQGAKFFEPMRINYVLVDASVETTKKPSLADKAFFDEFNKQIMKPVDDYVRKLIKVYRFDINSGSKCETAVSDSAGNKFGFSVQMDDYLKGYVRLI